LAKNSCASSSRRLEFEYWTRILVRDASDVRQVLPYMFSDCSIKMTCLPASVSACAAVLPLCRSRRSGHLR
jgi:hypothetical protein